MSIPLNPIIISSTTSISVALKQTAAARALKVSNKSSFDLQLTGFGGFGSRWLASGVEDLLIDQGESSGQLSINAFNTANLQNPPSGACLITVYLKDEPLPVGNWPVSIPSQVVNSVSNTTSIVENDGNPAGTVFVGSIVTGDGTNKSVSITNDGIVIIGDVANPGSLTLAGPAILNGALTAKGLIVLAAAGLLTHVLGGLTVDQNLLVSGASTQVGVITSNNGISIVEGGQTTDIFNDAADGGRFRINVPGAAKFYVNGVSTFHVDSNGVGISSGKYFTLASSFSRISFVTFTSVNGTTAAINHNLGATPAVIVGNAYSTGVNASNVTLGFSEIGATTFKCTSIAAVNVVAICMAN